MTERLTPSELVYLFVDGEATADERSEMYAALASDSDLQSEFEDALRLKQTTDEEVAAVIPPYSATKELFLKAGFTMPVPIAGGEAIAPVISHLAEGGGWLASLKSVVLPFVAATGIATTAIVNMPFFERIDLRNSQQSEAPRTTLASPASTNASLLNAPLVLAERSAGTSEVNSTTQLDRTAYRTSRDLLPVVHTPAEEQAQSDVVAAEEVSAVNAPAQQIAANIETVGESKEEHKSIMRIRLESESSEHHDLWFGSNGIAGLSLFPSRGTEGAGTVAINNLAVSAEYEFAPGERIGIAAGTETFPHFVVTNDTILTQKWNIIWGGLTYSIAAYDLSIGPLVPVFATMLGGTSTGPLGKLSAGLSWQPADRVRFAAGIETTALMYHFGSNNRVAGKLGATYSVTVKF